MFNENRIEFSNINTYGTPRWLTFIVENISEKQSNLEEEVKINKFLTIDLLDNNIIKMSSTNINISKYDSKISIAYIWAVQRHW